MRGTSKLVTLMSIVGMIAMWSLEASAVEYRTTATFENPSGGVNSGVGTSQLTFGTGQPGVLTFVGITAAGRIPVGQNTIFGQVILSNGVTNTGSAPQFVDLDMLIEECEDIPTTSCVIPNNQNTFNGIAEIMFIHTANSTGDPVLDADSFCVTLQFGSPNIRCAWVPEGSTNTFTILTAISSIIITDIIPSNDGGFVTIGTDPTVNQIVPVQILIEANNVKNRVTIGDEANVKVAILTTPAPTVFDASQVDPDSVTFGTADVATSAIKSKMKDIDKD